MSINIFSEVAVPWSPLMTVLLGGDSSFTDFRSKKQKEQMYINSIAEGFLDNGVLSETKHVVKLVTLSKNEWPLGLDSSWRYVRKSILDWGLSFCPAEVGLQLRLQYVAQLVTGEDLIIAMDPIKKSEDECILTVYCDLNGTRYLDGSLSSLEYYWDSGHTFVFAWRKKPNIYMVNLGIYGNDLVTFHNTLEEAGISVERSPWPGSILGSIPLSETMRLVKVVVLSIEKSEFPYGATFEDICDVAHNLGLSFCSAEVAPQLCLQKSQIFDEVPNLSVVSQPIIDTGPFWFFYRNELQFFLNKCDGLLCLGLQGKLQPYTKFSFIDGKKVYNFAFTCED
jgi:hypothetical protein